MTSCHEDTNFKDLNHVSVSVSVSMNLLYYLKWIVISQNTLSFDPMNGSSLEYHAILAPSNWWSYPCLIFPLSS